MPAPKQTHEEQHQMLLDAAVRCIQETSVIDFTMSSLSKASGLSMGSIYKHIQGKEDVFVLLAIEMYKGLAQTFEAVFALPLSPAVRLIALQLSKPVHTSCYTFGGHLEMLVTNEAILKRATPNKIDLLLASELQLETITHDFLETCVAEGDLSVKAEERACTLEKIMVGLWALQVGYTQVARQRDLRKLTNNSAPASFPVHAQSPIVQAQKNFLNLYDWRKPVTDEQIEEAIIVLEAHQLRSTS